MSTGEVLRVRAAMKPIATVPRALRTVDVATGEAAVAHHQRSDVCAVPAAGVVAEAMVALVLADAVLEKFGGDAVRGDPAQRRELPRLAEDSGERRDDRRRGWCWSGRWAPASRRSAGCSPSAGACRSATPTTTSSGPRAASISDIFVESGEEHFRALERAAVGRALARARRACSRSAAGR